MTAIHNSIIKYFVLVVTLCFILTRTVVGSELIGILPFENQRINKSDDWFGFYIQDRLVRSLKSEKTWRFHTLSTIKLWGKSDGTYPFITKKGTVLISGSFQKVGKFMKLNAQIKRQNSTKNQIKKFVLSFRDTNREKTINHLAQSIGKWIDPVFTPQTASKTTTRNPEQLQSIYEYRKELYSSKSIPEIRRLVFLQDFITPDSLPAEIGDLVEGMLILSMGLQDQEKISLITKSRRLLKKSLINYPKNARLHALMAETFFLGHESLEWIEKTAKTATELDPQNDLAWLLLALARGIHSGSGKETLQKLALINPFIWSQKKSRGINFQKNILKKQITEAHSIYLTIGKPDFLQ